MFDGFAQNAGKCILPYETFPVQCKASDLQPIGCLFNAEQIVHTRVLLSPRSIIWNWQMGGDSLQLGRNGG